jgi:outer membrane receptor protein involved in Fe transport
MNFRFLILFSTLLFAQVALSQPTGGRPGGGAGRMGANMNIGHFYGKFVDGKDGKAIAAVTVQLQGSKFDSVNKKRVPVIIGTQITPANGEFSFEGLAVMGNYKLIASAIGYKPFEKPLKFDVKFGGGAGQGEEGTDRMQSMIGMTDVDLGNIKLEPDPNDLGNVTVTSTKQMFELGIDRKIFNVDKNIVSAGQSATEIMRVIPSISVDIDGNVQLRNAAPQIFIDGRPTTLTLDQIPAEIVEKVEIITNPSAKYDASGGNAGIINIILKKNKKTGYNGGIRVGIDSRPRPNFGGDINYRENKINFFGSVNANFRKRIGNDYANTNFFGNNPFTVNSSNKTVNDGYFAFLRGGIDYFINNRNTLSLSGNFNRGKFDNDGRQLIDTMNTSLISLTNRNTLTSFNFRNYGAQLSYKHNFTKNGHSISSDLNYNASTNKSSNDINSLINNPSGTPKYPLYQQLGINDGSNKFFTWQLDYENPLTENTKFEAGARTAIRDFSITTLQYINDNASTNGFAISDRSSSRYKFTDMVHAAYGTYSFKYKKFSYQLGLRVESSNYTGTLQTLDGRDSVKFTVNFPLSLFPSAFITYKHSQKEDFQINYSRRVNRPSFFQLLPIYDFTDPQNPQVGAPGLTPEFTHSFELSYNNNYKKGANFLATAYFKYSTNLITRYIFKDINKNVQAGVTADDSLFYTSYINANTALSYGLELTNRMPVTKWWELTLNLNIFNSQINANIPGQQIDNSIVTWFAKMNNNFKLGKNWTLQFSGDARSKTLIPQGGGGGRRGGGFFGGGQQTLAQGYTLPRLFDMDIALRKDWTWKNGQSGSLSLSMNNIFRTPTETYTEAIFFNQNTNRISDPQVLRLNFSYRFGKFDVSLFKRKNTKADQSGGADMGGMGM